MFSLERALMASTVFLNYRRSDSAGFVGRLEDHLQDRFPGIQFFRDIETIAPGVDFVDEINKRLDACNIVLAVVGPHWLSEKGSRGRRIRDPDDWVRRELAVALARRALVIPVLVGGAKMPSAGELPDDLRRFSEIQAHELTDERWDFDVQVLAKRLFELPGFELEQKVASMDREWEAERKQYLVTDKEGHAREPNSSVTWMVVMAVLFGLLWSCLSLGVGSEFGKELGPAARLGAIAFALAGPAMAAAFIALSIREQKLYQRLKRAESAYQARRAKLIAGAAKASVVATPSRDAGAPSRTPIGEEAPPSRSPGTGEDR